MKKELFICDSCGARTRLDHAQRHWCVVCNQGAPVEMRYGKHKKPLIPDTVADDIILEGAAVHSIQSTYHERDFALHATASGTMALTNR
ncbi:MAG: hypothetical protein QOE81_1993 [Verrucomicrobiota bacterium]|jgi:hypothetical protein